MCLICHTAGNGSSERRRNRGQGERLQKIYEGIHCEESGGYKAGRTYPRPQKTERIVETLYKAGLTDEGKDRGVDRQIEPDI